MRSNRLVLALAAVFLALIAGALTWISARATRPLDGSASDARAARPSIALERAGRADPAAAAAEPAEPDEVRTTPAPERRVVLEAQAAAAALRYHVLCTDVDGTPRAGVHVELVTVAGRPAPSPSGTPAWVTDANGRAAVALADAFSWARAPTLGHDLERVLARGQTYLEARVAGRAPTVVLCDASHLDASTPHAIVLAQGATVTVVLDGVAPACAPVLVALSWDARDVLPDGWGRGAQVAYATSPTTGRTRIQSGRASLPFVRATSALGDTVAFPDQPIGPHFHVLVSCAHGDSLRRGPYRSAPGGTTVRVALESCRIEGRLVDAAGGPLAGRRVLLVPQKAGAGPLLLRHPQRARAEALTDGAGAFRFEDLCADAYALVACGPDREPVHASDREVYAFGALLPEACGARVEVRVPDAFAPVRGHVVDAQGAPVPDTTVSLGPAGWTGALITRTDREGAFSFDRVPVGSCSVRVLAQGQLADLRSLEVSTALEDVRLVLGRGAELAVRARTPSGGVAAIARVDLSTEGRSWGGGTDVDRTTWTVAGLEPGAYELAVRSTEGLVGMLAIEVDSEAQTVEVPLEPGRRLRLANPRGRDSLVLAWERDGVRVALGAIGPREADAWVVPAAAGSLVWGPKAGAGRSGFMVLPAGVDDLEIDLPE